MRNSSSERTYEYYESFDSYTETVDNNVIQFNDFLQEETAATETIYLSLNTSKYISYYFWKGIFDKIFAAIGLIASLPFFLLIAMLIKIDSKGPVLFKQERIGVNSKSFKIYKFRTMFLSAPNVPTNELQNSQSEKYVTKTGRILRKLSIDELPQLINIVKGEMSFIGPRPMIKKHEYLINMRKLRGIDVLLPGISGLAQVNGRDEIPDEEKLEYDECYLREFGIKEDIRILIRTIKKVLRKEDITL